MPIPVQYAENIIVGVVYEGKWIWYISPADLWILDREKYHKKIEERYGSSKVFVGPMSADGYDIAVVNEITAKRFLDETVRFRVDVSHLRGLVKERISVSRSKSIPPEEFNRFLDEAIELFPSLLVNFDEKRLTSSYPEPMGYENYVPNNWQGEYRSIMPDIPLDQRYWIIDRENYFHFLEAR